MGAYNAKLFDDQGRPIRPVVFNTATDGSGTWLFALLDSDGHIQADTLSIVPGTGATNLGKAEDAAHTSGDTGVMLLGVRKDAAAILAGADGDYVPIIVDAYGRLHTAPLVSVVHTEHPFGKGDLTSDGVQYSDVVSTTDDTEVEVEQITVEPPAAGTIVEVEFGLTIAILNAAADKDVTVKWRARDKDGTYVTLNETTFDNPGVAYVEKSVSGRFETVANFDAVPFDVSVTIKREAAGANASGKVKNSSYIRVIYNPA